MAEKKKTPTMSDVAKLAGVSQTTVSLVLNGKAADNIPEETKERILSCSRELGYSVNKLAGAINGSGSGIIGVIADSIVTQDFAGELIGGMQNAAWKKDKTLMITAIDETENQAEKVMELLLGYRVEALIYATSYYHEIRLSEKVNSFTDIPVVLVNCYEKTNTRSCIVPDDYEGAYQITKYVTSCGHKKIHYVSNAKLLDGEKIPATTLREKGFIKAMKEAGISGAGNKISAINITGREVYQAALQLLDSPDRPTAVVCYNDRMALGVYAAAQALNLRIPEDLSVVGYDNHSVVVDFIQPKLTTVALPHFEMGEKAIRYIYAHKNLEEYVKRKIKPQIIINDSVRKV